MRIIRKMVSLLLAGALLPQLVTACAMTTGGESGTGQRGCAAPGCREEIAAACARSTSRESMITCAHNVVRRSASPRPAAPLQPLSYDKMLATVAQRWAEQCKFAHSATGGLVGENIFVSSDFGVPVEEAVISWASESEYYGLGKKSCKRGEACGHYTQVVWAGTSRLGCGIALCQADAGGTLAYSFKNIVCNYAPPGNYIGEAPYEAGPGSRTAVRPGG